MKISMDKVKELRDRTGLGIMDCKKALEKNDSDVEKSIDFLRKEGSLKAAKKSGRATKEGVIHAYIHYNKKLGVLVEINCETDFVANTPEFDKLAHDIAVHIGAVEPLYVSRDDVPAEVIEKEKEIYKVQLLESGKPEEVIEKIMVNKVEKYYEENCMLEQEFFGSDDHKTVDQYIKENIGKFGENINIGRFVLYKVGV